MINKYLFKIPGFSKYAIDLVNHKVYNKWGKEVQSRIDNRGRRVVTISRNNTTRTVKTIEMIVKDVLDKNVIKKRLGSNRLKIDTSVSYVYHIKRSNMSIEEGYIGVSVDPQHRLGGHIRDTRSPIYKYVNKFDDIELDIVFEGTRKQCFKEENRLRSEANMGWNIAPGGNSNWWRWRK